MIWRQTCWIGFETEFKKGAIFRVDVDEMPPAGPADLRWFLTPRVLRSIKKR